MKSTKLLRDAETLIMIIRTLDTLSNVDDATMFCIANELIRVIEKYKVTLMIDEMKED